jgi:hypothetical protein
LATANLICEAKLFPDAYGETHTGSESTWLELRDLPKCGKLMAHWNRKEYDFRDGVRLYSETAQNISTEGVPVMTGSERAAHDFRSLNVQPCRGDEWDMTKELQAFSFECPEQHAFQMSPRPPLNHLVWVKKDTPARFARGWLYALINTS